MVTVASARGHSPHDAVKLTQLTDSDNIESYLTIFERVMAPNAINKGYCLLVIVSRTRLHAAVYQNSVNVKLLL